MAHLAGDGFRTNMARKEVKTFTLSARKEVLDFWTVEAMSKYGGSFVQCLAELLRRADPINKAKIIRTWPDYWNEYERIGHTLRRHEKELIDEQS